MQGSRGRLRSLPLPGGLQRGAPAECLDLKRAPATPTSPGYPLPMHTVFIAGATGYTGRHVVAACAARGLNTIAHIRPGSSSGPRWRGTFEEQGAVVDESAWTPEAMQDAMARHQPELVFSLLGITAKRGKQEGSSYQSVDYGLTVLLLEAAATLKSPPVFVYLSSAGAGGPSMGAYMKARVMSEAAIRASEIPHLIARPSFITGEDRDESRPGERVAAVLADGLLGGLAKVGLGGPRKAWGSLTGTQLGEALVRLALAERRGVVEATDLHEALDD